jgi:NF-kappa-B inhibitor-like protein 1
MLISENVNIFSIFLDRKKYNKLHLNEIVVNKKGETLLHLACRLCKPQIVRTLIENDLGDPTAEDLKGNTALHLALKSVMKIDQKYDYLNGNSLFIMYYLQLKIKRKYVVLLFTAYRDLILANLKDLSVSLPFQNHQGQRAEELLELADSVYKYHQTTKPVSNNNLQSSEEQEWKNKLAAELDDEYSSSWGKYENDYIQPDVDEAESYDSWAKRIIHEYKKKTKLSGLPPPPKPEVKSSWTEEDQRKFIEEEEKRKQQQKLSEINHKRLQFLTKLRVMVQSENPIAIQDLPFSLSENINSICQLILFHLKELEDADEKRKALRNLQLLWHPDKFSQKFGQRLQESDRENVLKKVTEISQYLNTFDFQTTC